MKYFELPPLFQQAISVPVSDTDSLRMLHFLDRIIPYHFKDIGRNIKLVNHMVSVLSNLEGDPESIVERQRVMRWMYDNPDFLSFVGTLGYEESDPGREEEFIAYSDKRRNAVDSLKKFFKQMDQLIDFLMNSGVDKLVRLAKSIKDSSESNRRLAIMRSVNTKNQQPIQYRCQMELLVKNSAYDRRIIYELSDETAFEQVIFSDGEIDFYRDIVIGEDFYERCNTIIPEIFLSEFAKVLFKKYRSRLRTLMGTPQTISVKIEATYTRGSYSGITGSFNFPGEEAQVFNFALNRKKRIRFVSGEEKGLVEYSDDYQHYLDRFYQALYKASTSRVQGSISLFKNLEEVHKEFIISILDIIGYAGILQGMKNLVGEKSELVCWPKLADPEAKTLRFKGLKNMLLSSSIGVDEVVENQFFNDQPIILTGANANGKSNWLNAITYGYIFGQLGLPVIGKEFVFSPVSSIFTHYVRGAEGDFDESRFQDELVRLSFIFQNLDENSVLFFDEAFTGTRAEDGIEQSLAVLELAQELGVKIFFSTHYTELTEMPNVLTSYENYHAKINFKKEQPVCSYKIVKGTATINTRQFLTKNMGVDKPGLRKILKKRKLVA